MKNLCMIVAKLHQRCLAATIFICTMPISDMDKEHVGFALSVNEQLLRVINSNCPKFIKIEMGSVYVLCFTEILRENHFQNFTIDKCLVADFWETDESMKQRSWLCSPN